VETPQPKKRSITSPEEIYEVAKGTGWRTREDTGSKDIPELLCLMHSEISEALEARRNNIMEGAKGCMSEELADVIIRIFHFSEIFGIDIAKAVAEKHETNKHRPHRHGGKSC